ncbi:hypothetical protein Tco_0323521 [Tanacetum coccineum]
MRIQDPLGFCYIDIHAEGMTLSETFKLPAINEKLPPSRTTSWLRKTLIHQILPRANMWFGGCSTSEKDIGASWATRHVCADKIRCTADIRGEGEVILRVDDIRDKAQ